MCFGCFFEKKGWSFFSDRRFSGRRFSALCFCVLAVCWMSRPVRAEPEGESRTAAAGEAAAHEAAKQKSAGVERGDQSGRVGGPGQMGQADEGPAQESVAAVLSAYLVLWVVLFGYLLKLRGGQVRLARRAEALARLIEGRQMKRDDGKDREEVRGEV
jgi:CcmD family protein